MLYIGAFVAPLVGAWIEIRYAEQYSNALLSLLSWERGLKYRHTLTYLVAVAVAPLVGAWIEIKISDAVGLSVFCRSSRGSVD